jgi:tRNA pseudouridine38-40 synthase
MPSFALLLAYDGTAFAGWWRQPGRRTVAAELDAACRRIGEGTAAAIGASRTDAGVHARGQVARVDLERGWEPAGLLRALARQLPADLSCLGLAAVAPSWHPCHDATAKTYRYRIDNAAIGDPFAARFAWRPPFRLELADLGAAARAIPGRRDWGGFVRRGESRAGAGALVRTISRVEWHAAGGALECTVTGEAFTYRLVRSLVGAMVAVAQGGCTAAELQRALVGGDSPAGRQQAPACGLCLERVHYQPDLEWVGPGSWNSRAVESVL